MLLAVTALLGFVVAACGDDDESTTTDTSAEPTTPSASDTDSPEGQATFDVYLLPAEIGDDCSAVISSEREAQADGDVGDALAQLLAGPTAEEQAEGMGSWFSDETAGMLNGVAIEDGVADVDFADFSGVIPNASSSCGSTSLLAQLDSTVLQFPEVDEVVYSFDGDEAAFYEWLQLSPPE
jgi:spore germination protein GerM